LLPLAWLTGTSYSFGQIYYRPPLYPPFGYPKPYPRAHDPLPEPKDDPVEIGIYGAIGGSIGDTPPPPHGYPIGALGLYARWNRYGHCPGLDVRVHGNGSQLHGYLVGPRVAYQPRNPRMRPLRLYAEGLFVKNEVSYSHNTATSITQRHTEGTCRRDPIHRPRPRSPRQRTLEWRVSEFSKGDITGLRSSYPQTLQRGLLFHFP
jgi:hypothetical protein